MSNLLIVGGVSRGGTRSFHKGNLLYVDPGIDVLGVELDGSDRDLRQAV